MSTPRGLALPATVRALTLRSLRHQHAVLLAEPRSGVPLGMAVLVPGFTGSKEDFLSILDPLAAGGFATATFDQRGQYESALDAACPDGQPLTLEQLADDLIALVDVLSPTSPVHLVGHSFGGLVARVATMRHPERVASLILMCSGPGALPESQRALLDALVSALGALPIETVWEAKEHLDRAHGVAPLDPEVHEFMHRRFVSNDPVSLAAKAGMLTTEPDRTDEFAHVLSAHGIAALVMHGQTDDAWPIDEQERMSVRLRADLVVIPSAGHSPAVDQPEATAAALLSFWNSPLGSPSRAESV